MGGRGASHAFAWRVKKGPNLAGPCARPDMPCSPRTGTGRGTRPRRVSYKRIMRDIFHMFFRAEGANPWSVLLALLAAKIAEGREDARS